MLIFPIFPILYVQICVHNKLCSYSASYSGAGAYELPKLPPLAAHIGVKLHVGNEVGGTKQLSQYS